MTALKMAKHQHMTAYASQGHTRYLSTPPSFMQFKTYHYYPVKNVDAKSWLSPSLTIRIYCSQLWCKVLFFFPRCPFLLKGLIYAEDLCKTWLMSRLTLDGRLGSLMNCMLCLRFDIEHVSVSLYVFKTTYKHTFRVGLQGWYGAHNRFIDFAIFGFLNLQGMYTAKSTVQQLTAT